MNFLARKSTVDERLEFCSSCEHNKLGICRKCGCIIQAKARLGNHYCPIGLWGRESQGIKDLTEN